MHLEVALVGRRVDQLHDDLVADQWIAAPVLRDAGEPAVQTRLIRHDDAPVELDYVMRSGLTRWQIVDVPTDGSISSVAVQRSDFRQLLESGGVTALTAGLERKIANLSGSLQG